MVNKAGPNTTIKLASGHVYQDFDEMLIRRKSEFDFESTLAQRDCTYSSKQLKKSSKSLPDLNSAHLYGFPTSNGIFKASASFVLRDQGRMVKSDDHGGKGQMAKSNDELSPWSSWILRCRGALSVLYMRKR